MQYRRRHGSDTFHFCENCRWWPTNVATYRAVDRTEGRPHGDLCNECLSKERRDDCRAV